METITKYKAYTGCEFNSEVECLRHEGNCKIADAIVAQLPETTGKMFNSSGFVNGDGYIQHDMELLEKVKRELLKQARKEHPDEVMLEKGRHTSHADRYLSEAGNVRLRRAWSRICRIDDQGREWGQQYYVLHPEDAKHVCLNP